MQIDSKVLLERLKRHKSSDNYVGWFVRYDTIGRVIHYMEREAEKEAKSNEKGTG